MQKMNTGLAPEYIDDGSSFFLVDPLSISPETLSNFVLFERFGKNGNTYKFRCLLTDSDALPRERLMALLRSWDDVYIHKRQQTAYKEYVRENLEYILDHDEIDIKKKTDTLVSLSTDVIKASLSDNFKTFEGAQAVVENVEHLVARAVDFIAGMESLKGISALAGHDYDTHTHSVKVGWLMATFINANQDLINVKTKKSLRDIMIRAAVAGFLHDIGKVKIPKNVINKNGRLDNLEYGLIQAHTAYSVSLLFDTNLPKSCMQAILYHHENEDGSGYPSGLKGDRIPVLAKICHIVDVFDALTSKRSYKQAKTPFEALGIMAGKNPHLDALQQFEAEAKENKRAPVTAVVRDKYEEKLKRLREREILEEEAEKRVEARNKLRDQGMAHCFNADLLKRFVLTINKSGSFDLSGLL